MPRDSLGAGILWGLVVCLSLGLLLLGVELSQAMGGADQLSEVSSAVVAGTAVVLYGAVAWRSARGQGGRAFGAWWGTMLAAHAGLGLAAGALGSALRSVAAQPGDVAQWAAGASLSMAILQVGYGIGAAALAWGRESEPIPAAPEAPRPQPPPTPPPVAAPAPKTEPPAERAPHLEIYAKAVERVRAPDYDSLVRFAAQAARCEGALLATPDGLLVASVSGGGLDPARVAAVLPELLRDLGKLSAPADGSRTLIHAAFGGHELLAGPGKRLVGCLLGPEPAARETAEVVLSALLARADGLWVNLQLLGAEGLPSATASDSPAEENAL